MSIEERRKQLTRRILLFTMFASFGAGYVTGHNTGKENSGDEINIGSTTSEMTTENIDDEFIISEDQVINDYYIGNLLYEYNLKTGKNLNVESLGIDKFETPLYTVESIDENGNKRVIFDIDIANNELPEGMRHSKVEDLYVYVNTTDKSLIGAIGKDENGNYVNVEISYLIYINDSKAVKYYSSEGYLKLDTKSDHEQAQKYFIARQEYLEESKSLSYKN